VGGDRGPDEQQREQRLDGQAVGERRDQHVVQRDQHHDQGERESRHRNVAVLLERGAEEQSIGAEGPEHARDEDELIDAGAEREAWGEAGGRRHCRHCTWRT
jgi:hypothetical protein